MVINFEEKLDIITRRNKDQISEDIMSEITSSITNDFMLLNKQATINANRKVCLAKGYSFDEVTGECLHNEMTCNRDSEANIIRNRQQCEIDRANLKRKCRDGDNSACDEYDSRFIQKKGLFETQDVGCPQYEDSGYSEWLNGNCVGAAASWRNFCVSKNLTYYSDPSGMGQCRTNESYCKNKAVEWQTPNRENQYGDCHISPTQWVAEAILGTTITRIVNLGFNYLEKGVAFITNERLARGLSTAMNPLTSPLVPWGAGLLIVELLINPEAAITKMENLVSDLVIGGCQLISDAAVGFYNFLDKYGLVPEGVKEIGRAIGAGIKIIAETFAPITRVIADVVKKAYEVVRYIIVAVFGTIADMFHGDFSFRRLGELFNKTWDLIGGALIDVGNAIGTFITNLGSIEGILTNLRNLRDLAITIFNGIVKAIVWIGNFIVSLGVLIEKLTVIIYEILAGAIKALGEIIIGLSKAIIYLANKIVTLSAKIADLGKSINNAIKKAWKDVKSFFSGW